MGKKKDVKKEALIRNNQTYIDYYDRLKLLSTSLFTYEGLDDIFGYGASRFLENALFSKGKAVFVKDPTRGFMVCNANPSDQLNIYNLPTAVEAFNIGYNKKFLLDDCVLIMNNEMQKPTSSTVELFAYRMYDIQRTMDVNLTAQKTPVLLMGDEKSMLTLQNVYEQWSGNCPVIFGDKNYGLDQNTTVLSTEAPYLLDKLALYKHEVWNECLTFLGINNANTDKNQVVLTPEINANNDLVNFYLNCTYSTRKKAVDLMNEKWNLNIELKINKNMAELLGEAANQIFKEEENQEKTGGSASGSIHNND